MCTPKAYQSVLVPVNTLLLVGVGVGETLDLARLAAEEAVQSGSDLVAAAILDGVALSATGLEEVGTLLGVTYSLLSVKDLVTIGSGCRQAPSRPRW